MKEVVEHTGMSYSGLLEWRFAAQWAHMPYVEFMRMGGEEQSRTVAAFRVHQQMQAVLSREGKRSSDRAARRARGKRQNPNS